LKTNFNIGRMKVRTKSNQKILSVLLLTLFCNISQAKFAIPIPVPIDRLIANATAYVKEKPTDAHGYYILARIHYLAFANQTQQVNAFNEGKDSPPMVAENWQPQNQMQAGDMSQNELIEHLTTAIDNFKKAIELDSKNGLYHLGLASLFEQYVDYANKTDLKVLPEEFRNIILNYAADIYYTAYELSIKEDLKNERLPISGLSSLTGYEAGNAYIRLIERDKSITEEQKKILAEVHKNVDTLGNLRRGAITPIVFSFENTISPTELLERDLQVNFDLDGDGASELWPWVKPSTGILVWNEDDKGEITSGRQLFGSVTWWLFFNNGYHALDCLDDNRDGFLGGKELKGISVWFDTNSNGKSEKEEIKSLEELGIISISTKATSTENGWPANKTGITLKSGQTIPSYDWIAKPSK